MTLQNRSIWFIIFSLLAVAPAIVSAQQIVVTVDQDSADATRVQVENAVIGGLFDAGYIVWSDAPQGFLSGGISGDNHNPLQVEYAAVRYARESGAQYLIQIRLAPAEMVFDEMIHYTVIDVVRPRVIESASFHGSEILLNGDADRNAQLLGAHISAGADDVIREYEQ